MMPTRSRSIKLVVTGIVIGVMMAISAPSAAADDRTRVPMSGIFKRCDFSANTFVPATGDGRALALVNSVRGRVVAEVRLVTAKPDTHYTVRLIQTPRTSLNCTSADPGVTVGSLRTDAVGAATTTLEAPLVSSAAGAWVFIDRSAEFSQIPAEFYTSDFIARVTGNP